MSTITTTGANPMEPNSDRQGWQCGGCKRWYAPHVEKCDCQMSAGQQLDNPFLPPFAPLPLPAPYIWNPPYTPWPDAYTPIKFTSRPNLFEQNNVWYSFATTASASIPPFNFTQFDVTGSTQ